MRCILLAGMMLWVGCVVAVALDHRNHRSGMDFAPGVILLDEIHMPIVQPHGPHIMEYTWTEVHDGLFGRHGGPPVALVLIAAGLLALFLIHRVSSNRRYRRRAAARHTRSATGGPATAKMERDLAEIRALENILYRLERRIETLESSVMR